MSRKKLQATKEMTSLPPMGQFQAALYGRLWTEMREALDLALDFKKVIEYEKGNDPCLVTLFALFPTKKQIAEWRKEVNGKLAKLFEIAIESGNGKILRQLAEVVENKDKPGDEVRLYVVNYLSWKEGLEIYSKKRPIQTSVTLRELSNQLHLHVANPPDDSDLRRLVTELGYLFKKDKLGRPELK